MSPPAVLPTEYFRVRSTKADAVASGIDAVAVGPEANAGGASSIALGDGASTQAAAEGAIALGRNAAAAGKRSMALGDGASVDSEFVEDAIAMGTGAQKSEEHTSEIQSL